MGEPYLGEVKLISWNYAPKGWAFCNGQLLPINQNQALFSLLGTTYGGNGQTTLHCLTCAGARRCTWARDSTLGKIGGEEFHTLIKSEMPAHNHIVNASDTQGNAEHRAGQHPRARGRQSLWRLPCQPQHSTLAPDTVTNTGGSQPHENRQPYPGAQCHHRPAGHLPVAKLRRARHGNPYIGEIRMFGGNFAPAGWHFCNGAAAPDLGKRALFNLIGTTYGGDGPDQLRPARSAGARSRSTRGRARDHAQLRARRTGRRRDRDADDATLPIHSHPFMARTAAASEPSPNGNVLGNLGDVSAVRARRRGSATGCRPRFRSDGGNQPHDNMMPFLCVNFIISLFGIFPPQS